MLGRKIWFWTIVALFIILLYLEAVNYKKVREHEYFAGKFMPVWRYLYIVWRGKSLCPDAPADLINLFETGKRVQIAKILLIISGLLVLPLILIWLNIF